MLKVTKSKSNLLQWPSGRKKRHPASPMHPREGSHHLTPSSHAQLPSSGLQPACRPRWKRVPQTCTIRGLRVAGRELSGAGQRDMAHGTCEKGVWGETRMMGAMCAHLWLCSSKTSIVIKLRKGTVVQWAEMGKDWSPESKQ